MFTTKANYLYVEPTSHCVLKCPRCPRTYSPESYSPNHLDLNVYKDFIQSKYFGNLDYVEFGGNLGDPIYHPEIISFISVTQEALPSTKVVIHTNGTQGKRKWEDMVNQLRGIDIVLFSVDGLEQSNHHYRVNSNWELILEGMRISAKKCHTVWKYIVFSHNQHLIEEAIKLAKQLDIKTFLLTKSSVFNGDWLVDGIDPLAPTANWQFNPSVDNFEKPTISARCQNQSMHYLDSNGRYSPCCWINTDNNFCISASGPDFIEKTLNGEVLRNLKESWSSGSPHSICGRKCRDSSNNQKRSSHSQLEINLNQEINVIRDMVEDFSRSS